MSRGIVAGVTTAVDAPHVHWFPLLDLDFDSGTTYLCGAAHDVAYNGNTYQAALGLGTIEAIEETDAGVMGLAFTLSHVPSSSISLALGTDVQGRGVLLRLAFIDTGGVLRVDDNVWSGYLDQMTIEDGPNGGQVRVTAEHRLVRWDTPRVWRFSNEDQQLVSAGDRFFEYAAAMTQAVILWPSKEFFKQ